MVIPLAIGLVGADGCDLPLELGEGTTPDRAVLTLSKPAQSFVFADIAVPPVDLASKEMKELKETLDRGLTDEEVAQYVTKLEKDVGTSINEAAFAQVTGANNN